MHASGRALAAADRGEFDEATRIVRDAVRQIEALPELELPTFALERARSLGVLREMRKEIAEKKPLSEKGLIEKRLRQAIEAENYERAAQLRDMLRQMD